MKIAGIAFSSYAVELKAANAHFRFEPMETLVCHMAIIHDPDGNPLIIHKRKPGHH